MGPNPQQMPMPQQMTTEPPVATGYDVSMRAKMTPFAKAKYGLGGFTPASAPPASGAVSRFAPSGSSGVQVPRLQPLQFGGGGTNVLEKP
jgi:hypothetical protein